MIRVNLHESGKKKKSQERTIVLVLGPLLPTFVIVLVVFLILMFMQLNKENQVSELEERESTLKEKIEELEPEVALNRAEIEELEYQQEVIQHLMDRERISWTDNLQMIARTMPDQVFMYQMLLTEEGARRRGGSDDDDDTYYNLRLTGFAQADDADKELRLIAEFITSMQTNSLFQRNFDSSIDFDRTEKVSVANEVVSLFELNVTPKPPQD